jgi:enoyl-CoA hydratase
MSEQGSMLEISREGAVGIIRLNRPSVLNALNTALIHELVCELERMDQDDTIRAIVLTGHDKAFAAGADIGEMSGQTAVEMLLKDQFSVWNRIAGIKKPLIAAVSGYVLGGGCELMMICDMVIASETTKLGQPEIKLGIMPGAGGTQRLVRAVGQRKAVEMMLTGDPIDANEAYRCGLVNRVVPLESYLQEAVQLAQRIAAQPPVAVRMIKQATRKAEDLPLAEGLDFERNAFNMLFATEDAQDGMQAFREKRKAAFKGR